MEYIAQIKALIYECKAHYANVNLAPNLLWEILKMEIRKHSITYSARKKRERMAEQHIIENEITVLENNIHKTEQEHDHLLHCKNQLQIMFNNKIKGSIIRSRTNGYEFGDRPSSYFLNLEKKQTVKKNYL